MGSSRNIHPALFDLSVPFDDGILLGHLWELGVSDKVLCWFSSFLQGQFQSVLTEGERSRYGPFVVASGFSFLQFNIYMIHCMR